MGPPQPPALRLPQPPTDLRAARKGDKVHLSWTIPARTMDRERVRSLGPTRICRGLEPVLSECGTAVGDALPPKPAELSKSAGQKMQATYVDTLPQDLERSHPLGFGTYAVEVLNTKGRGAGLSNQVHVPLAETAPPPSDFKAQVTGKGVELTWTAELPSPSSEQPVRYLFRVFRRPQAGPQILAGEVRAGNERDFTLTDPSIEWEQTYYYRVAVVAVITQPDKSEVQVEGDDSPEVSVFAHDVFPPAVPSGLQAVFSGPGQQPFIDLIWAPVSDLDLAGYNVYRREEGGEWVKLTTEPIRNPAFRDVNIVPGRNYSYSVSAVDVRGNESARSEEAAERVPKT